LLLPLEGQRLELPVVDDLLRRREHDGAHHDLPRRGRCLQPGGSIDSVASEHPLTRPGGTLQVDQHLTRLDADPHLQARLMLRRECPVQLPENGLHLDGGPNRALGIVLVSRRDAEHGKDGVAHELLDEPAEPLDLPGQAVKGPTHHGLDDLGVLGLGQGRGSNHVGEQSGGELPFLTRGRRGRR